MKNYYNAIYNIIELKDYFENIKGYSLEKVITTTNKDYLQIIQKDYFKDFYSAMIDRDLEMRWNEDWYDQLEIYNFPFDYFVIDIDDLMNHDDDMVKVLSDIVFWLDMREDEKFHFLYRLLRISGEDLIVKVRLSARNIGIFPVNEKELGDGTEWYNTYKYSNLLI